MLLWSLPRCALDSALTLLEHAEVPELGFPTESSKKNWQDMARHQELRINHEVMKWLFGHTQHTFAFPCFLPFWLGHQARA